MHRVRQALPFLRGMGWEPVVIAVEESSIESYSTDELLTLTIPEDIRVYKVKALDVKKTRKFGLGSLSMRSYFSIRKKGNELLKNERFDLVYFSTTAFHVMALGPQWKRKYKVPFVVDIQDPWRNDFYLDKPANERPPKFFIAYNIDKYLEAQTIPFADGIISVSKGYCDTFISRYPSVKKEKCRVIPFGVSDIDLAVMRTHVKESTRVTLKQDKINIVYCGRGGYDMSFAVKIIFSAFAKGLAEQPALFSKLHFWFIGTSYATAGAGKPTIQPLAHELHLDDYVTEITDRVPYFETLFLLDQADILLVPGSTDTNYTASKIYPYIILQKKLLAVFHQNSSVVSLLAHLHYGELIAFDHQSAGIEAYIGQCYESLLKLLDKEYHGSFAPELFAPYTAGARTKEQVDFFNEVISGNRIFDAAVTDV